MGSSQSSSSPPRMRHFRHHTVVCPTTHRTKEQTKSTHSCGSHSNDWLEILLCSVLATRPSLKAKECSGNGSTSVTSRRLPSGGSGSTVSNDSTISYDSSPSSPVSSLGYQEQGRDLSNARPSDPQQPHPTHPKIFTIDKLQDLPHKTISRKKSSQCSDVMRRVDKHHDLLSESLKMTCCTISSPNNLANNLNKRQHNHHHNQYQRRGREPSMGDSSDSRSISSDPTVHLQEEKQKRSRSPALPCKSNKRRHSWSFVTSEARSCDEEARIADLARMYDRATWRMYDRIMKARARAAAAQNPIMMVPARHHHHHHLDLPKDINATYVSNACAYPSEEEPTKRDSAHSIEEFPFSFEMDH